MKPSREEVKDLAQSEFESAIGFGVSLDNFMRLGVACYEAGAKAMQDQRDYWKSRYERERDLYDRQTKTLAGAAAERAVSDKLLEALQRIAKLRIVEADETIDDYLGVITEAAVRKEQE